MLYRNVYNINTLLDQLKFIWSTKHLENDMGDPGIETISLKSLYWQAGSLTLVPPGKLYIKADIPKTSLKEFP